jgi:hypothetical protein
MGVRLLISRLASGPTRASAARTLALLCGLGFLLTVVILAAGGTLERWFFALLVWALFVYAPLRIILEAAGTLAPRVRRRLAAEAAENPGRFGPPVAAELTVDHLLDRDVVMPRITTPAQREKARDGAVAVLRAARTAGGGLPAAMGATLGCLDRWVTEIGPWAQREAGQNIQVRWREVRALAAMAAMAKVLLAAGDTGTRTAGPAGHSREALSEFLDSCLDYSDDLALDVEVRPWEEPSLGLGITPAQAADIREAWKAYVDTGPPALETRTAFITRLLASSRPARPSAS